MIKTPHLFQIAMLMVLLSGCSQHKMPKWLSGEWTFDAEATMANLQSVSSESVALTGGLQTLVIPMLKGMEMALTSDDLIITFQGKRTLHEIEVYEQAANMISIKQSDGVLLDFHKSEKGFWILSDDGQMQMFFERKKTPPDEDRSG